MCSWEPPSPDCHLPGAVKSMSDFLRSPVKLNYVASCIVLTPPKEKMNLMAIVKHFFLA